MLGRVVMPGGVLSGRGIAAADVAAGEAAAKLHPLAAGLQAFLAALRGQRLWIAGLLDVLASHGGHPKPEKKRPPAVDKGGLRPPSPSGRARRGPTLRRADSGAARLRARGRDFKCATRAGSG